MSKKAAPPSERRKLANASVDVLLTSGLFVGLIAALIQLTIKDRWAPLAPIFYALPLHVIAGLFLLLAGAWHRKGNRRRVVMHVGLGVVCFGLFFQMSWQPCPAVATEVVDETARIRVVSWNLFHGRLGGESVVNELAALEPDVAGLVECGDIAEATDAWGKAFPGYTVVPFGKEIVVATRGTIRKPKLIHLGEKSRVARCEIDLDGTTFRLCVVDLQPSLFRDKRPVFEELGRMTESMESPIIILGDFNAPSSSTCFEVLQSRFRRVVSLRGGGFGFTWPSLLPLWDIDQIWVDDRWRALDWSTHMTVHSDHRPLVVDLAASQD